MATIDPGAPSSATNATSHDWLLARPKGYNLFSDFNLRYCDPQSFNCLEEVREFLWLPKAKAEPKTLDHSIVRLLVVDGADRYRCSDIESAIFNTSYFFSPPNDKNSIHASIGRLQGSPTLGYILFETPPVTTGPYLFLFMAQGTSEFVPSDDFSRFREYLDGVWGVYIYNGKEFNITQVKDLDHIRRKLWGDLDTRHETFYNVATRLFYSLIMEHLEWTRDKAQEIHDQIARVESQIEAEVQLPVTASNSAYRTLSGTLHQCSKETRNLEIQQEFTAAAIKWMGNWHKGSHYYVVAQDLQGKLLEDYGIKVGTFREQIASNQMLLRDEMSFQLTLQNIELAKDAKKAAEMNRKRKIEQDKASADLAKLSMKIADRSLNIAKETSRDSRTMRGIAWVTMAFLPATFVSSFFGMNFFNGQQARPYFDGSAKNVWVFFVVALPISAVVLFIFWRWDKESQGKTRTGVQGIDP